MSETKKVARRFLLTVIWILFVLMTLTGIISAGERTEYINSGKESQTVKINNNLMHNAQCIMHNYADTANNADSAI